LWLLHLALRFRYDARRKLAPRPHAGRRTPKLKAIVEQARKKFPKAA
jgi:hypothetical protein